MKTIKLISTLILVLMFISVSGISSFASEPADGSSDNICKIIKESIKYPKHAVENGYTGSVDLIFTINEEGKLNIEKLSTDDKDISDNVKKQLSSVCLKAIKGSSNEHYAVTITFRLI
ncbi:MAG: hypothetical protein WCK84_12805 [Bacteroidota bacterium]